MAVTKTTKASDVITTLKSLNACAEAVAWCEKYNKVPWLELLDNADKARDFSFNESWHYWYLLKVGNETGVEVRLKHISLIKDPMAAFILYLKLDYLTAEESRLLETKFNGKLPRAEQELKDGIVKRRSNT